MEDTVDFPETVFVDTGYASGQAVQKLQEKGIEPLIAMKERLETTKAGDLYRLRKRIVSPVFGIIKSIMGFRRYSLRDLAKVTTKWLLFALALTAKEWHGFRQHKPGSLGLMTLKMANPTGC
uniref:transposase n=1 Tax=Novacetimonas hansenii TaxID=436 RepID=UPI0038D006D1